MPAKRDIDFNTKKAYGLKSVTLKDQDATPVGDLLLKDVDQVLRVRDSGDQADKSVAVSSVPDLPASKITSGAFDLARIPSPLTGKDADSVDGVHLPATIASVLSDHTKAVHDALAINADLLDSLHAADFALTGHTHAQLHDRGHTMASALDHTDWPAGLDVTELGYVNGVTSAIQAQIDAKFPTASHTKAVHDALAINADLLDSLHAADFALSGHTHSQYFLIADHTKATHDALAINADQVDGYDFDQELKKASNVQFAKMTLTDDQINPVKDAAPGDTPPVGTMRFVRLAANQNRIYVYTADGWQWFHFGGTGLQWWSDGVPYP